METTSPHFAPTIVAAQPPYKRQKNLTDKDRKTAWEFHIGTHAKEAYCLLCNVNKLVKNDIGSWQAGHVVARDYLDDPTLLSNPLYLIPCCAGCNLETTSDCVFNVLWERRKADAIKSICKRIFDSYKEMNSQHVLYYDNMIWKLVRGMYGFERHSLGGGIRLAYEEPIYKMLAIYQVSLLEQEISLQTVKMAKSVKLIEQLLSDSNRPCNAAKRVNSPWL
jgi:hypothetical protein